MEKEKKSKSKLVIIILLVVIVVIVAVAAFFMISGKSFGEMKEGMKAKDEYTVPLEEFVTNLKNEDKGKNYLKIQVALMYKDKKNTETINANISKIRDIVLNDLREKTSTEILEVENTPQLKEKMLEKLNESLGKKVIEEIYFTNLIVQ